MLRFGIAERGIVNNHTPFVTSPFGPIYSGVNVDGAIPPLLIYTLSLSERKLWHPLSPCCTQVTLRWWFEELNPLVLVGWKPPNHQFEKSFPCTFLRPRLGGNTACFTQCEHVKSCFHRFGDNSEQCVSMGLRLPQLLRAIASPCFVCSNLA